MKSKKSIAKFFFVFLSFAFFLPALAASEVGQTSFVAGLTGNQEVPPVNTNATGSVSFVTKMPDTMSYVLNATHLINSTGASVNIGKQGENGPVVVLLKTNAPTNVLNGTLLQGNIGSSDLEGPMKGKQLMDLADLMEKGGAYVNVFTIQHAKGEIRGQIGFAGIDESGTMAGQGNITKEAEEVD